MGKSHDRNFISKVLEGLDVDLNAVDIKVNVEEVSTLASSVMISSRGSSSMSISARNEKFLSARNVNYKNVFAVKRGSELWKDLNG